MPCYFQGVLLKCEICEIASEIVEVIYMVDIERAELVAYELMNLAMTLFNQWKKGTDEYAPHLRWACFEESFLGQLFL